MNNSKKMAALTWLMNHAENGRIPEYIGSDGRAYLVEFISSAIELKPSEEPLAPARAEITHGEIQGEYNATH